MACRITTDMGIQERKSCCWMVKIGCNCIDACSEAGLGNPPELELLSISDVQFKTLRKYGEPLSDLNHSRPALAQARQVGAFLPIFPWAGALPQDLDIELLGDIQEEVHAELHTGQGIGE